MAAPIPGKRPQRALTYRRHCALGGVEILSGHAVQHRYPRHFHDTMGIAVIHGGRELCWSRGAEREFTGGDIALFNAGEIHDGRPGGEQGWTYDMLHVEPARMHALLGVRDGWFDAVSLRDPQTRACARQLLQGPQDGLAADEALLALLRRVVHSPGRPHAPDGASAALLREFIDAHADQELGAARLAAVCGLSPEHAIRSFSRRYGITPHAYHQARRAESARGLLRGTLALSEVALSLGFYDQSHFSNWFRRAHGVAPSQYRQAMRP
ncbi:MULTISPECIES: helix-turn-helix domain-containing protein [Delftia]|jgi:AraC-like DNA-binding protein|uniref:AraC family transcriptional regulator n=1 Tax=Delftia acidovorans TaxID=80866 RepID=A0AAJ2R4G3_DELAC|nr:MULTISPECIES: AraC family transcriptional regulator [Delftia]MPT04089.1 AraC family transcriptional regulator [Delftia sp.]KFJ14175.1 helix-turn-helix domain protein [Delftia acidovorans]KLO57075.1 AraC family transcriptional regulator [Delftia tsuruhatensis]MBJ2143652.1 AraC family transcriptional regulator [Delftia acidovorans]MCG3781625.1 AraC family transcriptional regulator [Delftia acidovorans]